MFRSRLLVGIAFAVLLAMEWIDWSFPSPLMFYSPAASGNPAISQILVLKKGLEVGFSLVLSAIVATVLLSKRSGSAERLLAGGAIGFGLGFWLHQDVTYLLLH